MAGGKLKRKRAAVVVAALAIGLAAWQLWPAFDADQSASQQQQQAQHAAGASATQAGAVAQTLPEGVEPVEGAVEWPAKWDGVDWDGKKEGYIGADGEGGISRDDYASFDEYSEAVSGFGGGYENAVEPGEVEDSKGQRFEQGKLALTVEKDVWCEKEAHEFLRKRGGVWLCDDYYYRNNDTAYVTAYFEDCDSYAKLEAKKEEIAAVKGVRYVYASTLDISQDGNSGGAEHYQEIIESEGFKDAWDIVTCDHNVTVAVIDTDFDLDHPDLAKNIISPWDAANKSDLVADCANDDGHGTMVSGILSAVAGNREGIDGASYNALLMPIKWDDDNGNLSADYVFNALQRLNELDDAPEVVNMSLGWYGYRQDIKDAIDKLVLKGSAVVATAGNEGSAKQRYPASYDDVISVASVDAEGKRSWFSNYGPSVDICAAGECIYTTTNPHTEATSGVYYSDVYYEWDEEKGEQVEYPVSGTSFAAPQVSAAAALLKAQHPSWSAARVTARLTSTARKVSGMGGADRTDEYGYGVLDAAAAVGCKTGAALDVLGGADVGGKLERGMAYLESLGDAAPAGLRPTERWGESVCEEPQAKGAEHVTGAAAGGAASMLEMLGVDCVEESATGSALPDLLSWRNPRYLLFGNWTFNSNADPIAVNTVDNALEGCVSKSPSAVFGDRSGYFDRQEAAALAVYGKSAVDDAIWDMRPDIVMGDSVWFGRVDYMDEGYQSAFQNAGMENYYPRSVSYKASSLDSMVETVYAAAGAADELVSCSNGTLALRYGSAERQAMRYEAYVKGTKGYVLSRLEHDGLEEKRVACVVGYDAQEGTYEIARAGEQVGLLAGNRWLEACEGVSENLADVIDSDVATAEQLDMADLILIGGASRLCGAPEADPSPLLQTFRSGLQEKCFYVEGGTTGGTLWPADANGTDSAFAVGTILGCLYPEYLDQDNLVCYWYDKIYHVDCEALPFVVANAMDGVRSWSAPAPSLAEWTLADAESYAG